jgi:hypothetical protein
MARPLMKPQDKKSKNRPTVRTIVPGPAGYKGIWHDQESAAVFVSVGVESLKGF